MQPCASQPPPARRRPARLARRRTAWRYYQYREYPSVSWSLVSPSSLLPTEAYCTARQYVYIHTCWRTAASRSSVWFSALRAENHTAIQRTYRPAEGKKRRTRFSCYLHELRG